MVIFISGYIQRIYQVPSTQALTIACLSFIPTGDVTWYRNDTRIDIDGYLYSVSQRVTTFTASAYESTLMVRDDPVKDIIGRYSCGISGSQRSITIQGI